MVILRLGMGGYCGGLKILTAEASAISAPFVLSAVVFLSGANMGFNTTNLKKGKGSDFRLHDCRCPFAIATGGEETGGFEPPVQSPILRISSATRSTALARLRCKDRNYRLRGKFSLRSGQNPENGPLRLARGLLPNQMQVRDRLPDAAQLRRKRIR